MDCPTFQPPPPLQLRISLENLISYVHYPLKSITLLSNVAVWCSQRSRRVTAWPGSKTDCIHYYMTEKWASAAILIMLQPSNPLIIHTIWPLVTLVTREWGGWWAGGCLSSQSLQESFVCLGSVVWLTWDIALKVAYDWFKCFVCVWVIACCVVIAVSVQEQCLVIDASSVFGECLKHCRCNPLCHWSYTYTDPAYGSEWPLPYTEECKLIRLPRKYLSLCFLPTSTLKSKIYIKHLAITPWTHKVINLLF